MEAMITQGKECALPLLEYESYGFGWSGFCLTLERIINGILGPSG